jgi:hypothetical protein
MNRGIEAVAMTQHKQQRKQCCKRRARIFTVKASICTHQRHREMTANLRADQRNDQNPSDPKRPPKKRRMIVMVVVMMATEMAAPEMAMISALAPIAVPFRTERATLIVTAFIDGEVVAHTDTVFTHDVILSDLVDE